MVCSVWPTSRPVEQRIDQDRAVAVVPIQGHQAAGAGAKSLRLAGQAAWASPSAEYWAGASDLTNQLKMSPTADWPASRPYMSGRMEPGTMPHRPGMSGSWLSIGRDHHVAGAGADDLDQRARLDAGADRAHVGIEGADGHGHARRQTDLGRDFRREQAGLLVGRQGAGRIVLADAQPASGSRLHRNLALGSPPQAS